MASNRTKMSHEFHQLRIRGVGRIRHRRYGGSVYLYVLASSLLVTILGLGSLAAVRIQMRSARLARDSAEARACAVSAIELGRLQIKQNSNWRTTYPNGTWLDNKELGAGRFTLAGTDPVDGVLNDSVYEPLVLTGTGTRGIARHKAQVTLVPVIKPLALLSTCLRASGQVQVTLAQQVIAIGAPLSTNGPIVDNGAIDGDVQAQSISPSGCSISGSRTVPGPSMPMPDAAVFTDYISKATSVPYVAMIQKVALAPGCNPLGATDPNGFYVIDTGGRDLVIRNSRVYGTLIIRAAGRTVTVDDAMFMQNYRSDAPVLLVEGNLLIKLNSIAGPLSEGGVVNANFNPVGAPYNGITDSDKTDQYPNEIRGLVHVKGTLTLQQTARIVGTVICEGTVSCEGTNTTIIYDAGLYANPPKGYTYVDGMKVSPGTWKQVVD